MKSATANGSAWSRCCPTALTTVVPAIPGSPIAVCLTASSGSSTPAPPCRDEHFDRASYRQRNLIERVVGWYKECRRLGTRYEKLAVNYVAFWMVAIIEKVLNFGLSDSA